MLARFTYFKKWSKFPIQSRYVSSSTPDLSKYDPTQLKLLEERCILVNERDEIIGSASKKDSHTKALVNNGDMLHRAFSVLLFDSQNRLLLQKRSSEKITFPDCWTNTVCSHPHYTVNQSELPLLHRFVRQRSPLNTEVISINDCIDNLNDDESRLKSLNTNIELYSQLQSSLESKLGLIFDDDDSDDSDQSFNRQFLDIKISGLKNAAIQRLNYELGIDTNSITPDMLHCLTRVLYKADLDEYWSEFEMDYILIGRCDVELNVNSNEISDITYVTMDEMYQLLNNAIIHSVENRPLMNADSVLISPWFKILCDKFLKEWWSNLDNIVSNKVPFDPTIHNFL